MERRKFLVGTGALVAGSAAALGSGAFSSVEAERDVSVEVADDNSAYLGLEAERDDIISADGGDGTLSLDLGSQTTDQGGEGFNDDAITEIEGVFRITNQATEVYGDVIVSETEKDIDGDERFNGERTVDEGIEFTVQEFNTLGPGDSVLVDVEVDTLNHDPEDGSVTVVAGERVALY